MVYFSGSNSENPPKIDHLVMGHAIVTGIHGHWSLAFMHVSIPGDGWL